MPGSRTVRFCSPSWCFLPIGNLFAVPKDHRRFAAARDLRLYVDGTLRQHSPATEMVWDFDDINRIVP